MRRGLMRFKGTVGARRGESASSKARWVPDVSNPALPGLFGRPGGPFPPRRPRVNPGETKHPLHCTVPSFLLCSLARLVRVHTRCCVDHLSRPANRAYQTPDSTTVWLL